MLSDSESELFVTQASFSGSRSIDLSENNFESLFAEADNEKAVDNFNLRTVEQHDNPGNPERCIVRIFEKYQSKCPKLKPGSPLYLTPKRKVSSDDEVWYTKTPVGKNTLRKVVQDMRRVAGIEGYKTNHSLRATTCTIGLEKGVPEKLIMERTAHCTVKSLHTYQRVSDAQKEIVSDVLQGSATDFSGASVESDEPPTKKICECGSKENTAQFNFSNCSVIFNISK